MGNAKRGESSEYQSLATLIEPYMGARWDDVPPKLQELIRTRCQLLAVCWNESDASGRMKCATDNDLQHDPANQAENDYWWQLNAQVWQAQDRKRQLELSNPQGVPSELVTKSAALEAVNLRLRHLEALWKRPAFTVASWDDLTDARLADCINIGLSARPRTIALPAGTTHVNFRDLPHLIADALWPAVGPDDERMRYGVAHSNLVDELAKAVQSEALPVKDPLTFGPHPLPVGAALERAVVSVEDLSAFVAGRGLSVLFHFTVTEDDGSQTIYLATKEDHDAREAARRQRVTQRQARGFYLLHEAAQILAAAQGFEAGKYLRDRLRPAVESGALMLRDPIDQGPVTGRPCRMTDWVTPADIDRWLEAAPHHYHYRWPHEKLEPQSVPNGTAFAQTPTQDQAETTAPMLKQRAQENRILELLANREYDPLNLPKRKPGVRGVKSEAKSLALLEPALFTAKTFDTAWQRLRDDGRVVGGE